MFSLLEFSKSKKFNFRLADISKSLRPKKIGFTKKKYHYNYSKAKGELKMKAVWNDQIIAESDDTIVIEGNHYFPPDSLKKEFLKESSHTTGCPWKGIASYYHIEVNGDTNENAAWHYPEPKEAAKEIKDHVAFWKGVTVTS